MQKIPEVCYFNGHRPTQFLAESWRLTLPCDAVHMVAIVTWQAESTKQ